MPPSGAGRGLPLHLFRDASGTLRDRNIEEMARRLERAERLGGPFLTMLRRHAAMFAEAPPLPEEVLTDAAVAIDWAGAIGTVSICRLRPEQHPGDAARIQTLGLRYAATLETGRKTVPVFGRTIPLAVVLAVVQVMRDQAAQKNNPVRPAPPSSDSIH